MSICENLWLKFLRLPSQLYENENILFADFDDFFKLLRAKSHGADPRKNFNAESWEVYGAGAYLLAGSEIVKINP